jgi:hypothetical protein
MRVVKDDAFSRLPRARRSIDHDPASLRNGNPEMTSQAHIRRTGMRGNARTRAESGKVDEPGKTLDDVMRLENLREQRKSRTILFSSQSSFE